MKSERYSKFLAGLVTSLIILSLVISPVLAIAGDTTRVSVDSSGVQGNSYSSYLNLPSISASGRWVAFESGASNLVSGDTNGYWDIFVRDTQANTTTRISVDSSGVQGNEPSLSPSISADGRYVAFVSVASNLVSGDTNGMIDVFVRDTQTNSTTRVSLDSNGVEGNADSYDNSHNVLSISADGRYIAFVSDASNLVSGDTNVKYDVFLRDTQTNTTTRVSVDSSGMEGNSFSALPSISADGRYVAFVSGASNLVSGDTNGKNDVFVRDTQTNTTTRVTFASDGAQGNSHSIYPSISADGRYIAFMSDASNLVSGDTNGKSDVFLLDTQTNSTTRVSVDSSGVQGNSPSAFPSISADGRYVAFVSNASNLVNGDTNVKTDVFVRDTQTNSTTRVSLNSSGVQGNSDSEYPTISADGHYVAFMSEASNLVSGDTNGSSDVFVHENDVIQNEYTLIVTSANGTVAKNPDQATYHEGDVVQLTATPNAGWSFSNWAGGLTSADNPGFVTIHGNTSVTANYTQNAYTLFLPLILR